MLLGIDESFGGHEREAWSQSRKEAGYRGDSNPGPEAWACHHQCLLLFSAHVLTDKGEKQNLSAAMSRGQEKKHLRRFQALPGSLLPAQTPAKGSRGLQSPCLPIHVSHPHEKSMKSDPEGEPVCPETAGAVFCMSRHFQKDSMPPEGCLCVVGPGRRGNRNLTFVLYFPRFLLYVNNSQLNRSKN